MGRRRPSESLFQQIEDALPSGRLKNGVSDGLLRFGLFPLNNYHSIFVSIFIYQHFFSFYFQLFLYLFFVVFELFSIISASRVILLFEEYCIFPIIQPLSHQYPSISLYTYQLVPSVDPKYHSKNHKPHAHTL